MTTSTAAHELETQISLGWVRRTKDKKRWAVLLNVDPREPSRFGAAKKFFEAQGADFIPHDKSKPFPFMLDRDPDEHYVWLVLPEGWRISDKNDPLCELPQLITGLRDYGEVFVTNPRGENVGRVYRRQPREGGYPYGAYQGEGNRDAQAA